MDELSRLKLLIQVVEKGSFSAAARALGGTPSSASRQIAQLERELGVRLFHRTTRKQSLTEAGEIYFQRAKAIMADVEAARLAVVQLADAPSGDLHVTAEADLAVTLIAPILPIFLERYPKINVRLSMSPALVDLVGGGFDLAIRMGHLEDSSLFARRIAISRSQLYASPAYLAQKGAPREPTELAQHGCLSFRVGVTQNHWRFRTATGEISIPISGRTSANSLFFLKQLALAGQGVAMMPTWMTRTEVARGALRPVLENYQIIPPSTPISAVYAHNRQLAPKVRAFVDFLSEQVAEI
ncbi:MAG: LysR family transcriptional regulator [Neomegalonema sp.]|nr:LysR family transcriptional regulator [Neomegalonema sp.]